MPEGMNNAINMADIAWLVLRSGVDKCRESDESVDGQATPSWKEFNSCLTKEDIPQKVVAVLPIIPQPVMQYDTV